MTERADQVRSIVARRFKRRAVDLTDALRFEDDLGGDDLDLLDIVAQLEERFAITMPDETFAVLDTVGSLVAAVEGAKAENAA